MSTEPQSLNVRLIVGDKSSSGLVQVKTWSDKERLLNAVKALALWWFLAVLTIFIPIAHFVLVPGCLLLGPIVAAIKYSQRGLVLGGESTCPICGAVFKIASSRERWPLDDVCEGCHRHVRIEKSS